MTTTSEAVTTTQQAVTTTEAVTTTTEIERLSDMTDAEFTDAMSGACALTAVVVQEDVAEMSVEEWGLALTDLIAEKAPTGADAPRMLRQTAWVMQNHDCPIDSADIPPEVRRFIVEVGVWIEANA